MKRTVTGDRKWQRRRLLLCAERLLLQEVVVEISFFD